MPWWGWLWIGLSVLWSLAGAWDDWPQRWRSAVGIISGLCCCVCIAAFSDAQAASLLGRSLLPIAIAAAASTSADLYFDLKDLSRGEGFESGATVAVLALGLCFGSAIAAGFVRAADAW